MEHIEDASRYEARGETLASLLVAQGRRRDWLAAQAGIHPSFVTHLIAGRRTASRDVAERLAAALQVPLFVAFDRSTDARKRHGSESEDAA